MAMEYKSDRLTEEIIKCIITVHGILGPGFLESIYRKALIVEFEKAGLQADTEKDVHVVYKDVEVGRYRIDILVENAVILELKTVENLNDSHYAQIKSYLKASGITTGMLVNFSKARADFRRIEYP